MATDDKMTVSQAVDRRMSVRAFLPKPVPYETIRSILESARRTPSGGNVQPWHVDIVAGAKIDELRAIIARNIAEGVREELQYEIYPPKLWEPYRTYRFELGEDMYRLLGIDRDDKMGRLARFAENFKFFGAPVGLFFSLDKRMGPPQWSDVGMFMQTVMLLAVEEGLDTCPQECWQTWPDTIAQFFNYDENRILFAGMAMGYRDPDQKVNELRAKRAELDNFSSFHGF
ncbi:MAG: nitroreductase [Parvularculaceae bacterium]